MDSMQLSENPLKSRTREFLKSEKLLGFNKSQYQGEIASRLDKSIRYIYNILKNQKNLRDADIHDKINALTFYPILEYVLEDPKFEYQQKYDFRNIEFARLLFEVSAKYLKYSPLFKDDKYAQEEIDRASKRFSTLAKSFLEKESNKILTEEREEELKQKRKILQKNLDQLSTINSEYSKLYNQHNVFSNEVQKLDQEWNTMNTWIEKEKQSDKPVRNAIQIKRGLMYANKEKQKEINKKIIKIQNKMQEIKEPYTKKINKINEELQTKFTHLCYSYCPLNPLSEFNLYDNPHLPKEDRFQRKGI